MTLACRERSLEESEYLHAGRSYDGRNWEAVYPLNLPFACQPDDDFTTLCNFQVPPTKSCRITTISPSDTLSTEEAAARFLLKASFGPTSHEITSFPTSEKVRSLPSERSGPTSELF